MALVVAFVSGAVIGFILWVGLRPVFEHPMLARTNIHGRPVPTAGGLAIVLAPTLALASIQLVTFIRPTALPDEVHIGWAPVVVAALGFGLLGLIDDLLGDASARGFRGHLTALATGTLTTGSLKLIGGGVVAFLAVAQTQSPFGPLWRVAVDVAVVALAANLANLFDRAPGRVTKMGLLVAAGLVVAGPLTIVHGDHIVWPPVAPLFIVGAAVGLLLPELREEMMLGDTGANVIGAALGLGAVMALGDTTRLVVAGVLVALNLASERVSFSRVIASTPGLRQLDQMGRARE